MQAKVLIISCIIGVCAFIGPLNSTAFCGDSEDMTKYFESCIVNEIAQCDSKAVLLIRSRSSKLQNYALMQSQKAKFYHTEKEILAEEMAAMRLEPKEYKIKLFLNNRFQERDLYRKLATDI